MEVHIAMMTLKYTILYHLIFCLKIYELKRRRFLLFGLKQSFSFIAQKKGIRCTNHEISHFSDNKKTPFKALILQGCEKG